MRKFVLVENLDTMNQSHHPTWNIVYLSTLSLTAYSREIKVVQDSK